MSCVRRFLIFLIVYTYSLSITHAQIVNPMVQGSGREYFVGTTLGEPLITVNLVNGVTMPGVYHVPISTNMAELFSYAGGVTTGSDLNSVVVRSVQPSGQHAVKTYEFANTLANEKESLPRLNDRDIVQFEQNVNLDNTVKWMSVASMAASILAVFVIIDDRRD